MDLSRPARTLSPTLDLPVLSCLVAQERSWTTREIADATGATVPGVRDTLVRLARGGLVDQISLGRVRGYSLNREHVMAGPIRELVNAAATLRHRISEAVAAWAVPAELVVLFGSWARGEADSDSDVDLLILHSPLRPCDEAVWEGQTARLAELVRSWSGNYCDIVTFSTPDWADHLSRRDPIATAVTSGDAILLRGQRSLLAGVGESSWA